jgi:hypothetical protein
MAVYAAASQQLPRQILLLAQGYQKMCASHITVAHFSCQSSSCANQALHLFTAAHFTASLHVWEIFPMHPKNYTEVFQKIGCNLEKSC